MNKIEHIGIAVNNLEQSAKLFELLLGKPSYKEETVESEQVNTLFFNLGESKIELLKSLNADGTISKFIEKKGQGMHHLALKTDDIFAEIIRLKALDFEFLNEIPKNGADNKLIVFLHPRSTEGVLVELCQDKNN